MTEGPDPLLERVRSQFGLTAVGPHARVVDERVARVVAERGLDSDGALARLDIDRELFQELVEALVIPETYFFREAERLRCLVDAALSLLRRERADGHRLRVWSAGCSTGEEPYSFAMLLQEAGAAAAQVLATDVSTKALRHAAEAVFRRWSFRGVPPQVRARHFVAEEHHLRVSEAVREQVSFAELNLVTDAYPSGCDIILCRNVLVYLDPDVQHHVARRLTEALAPGGWLMTAATDPVLPDDLALEQVRTPAGFFYRRPTRVSLTTPPIRPCRRTTAPTPSKSTHVATEGDARTPEEATRHSDVEAPTPSDIEAIRTLIEQRALEEAAARVRTAVDATPLEPELRYLQAVLDLERGHPQEAATAATAAAYLAPDLAAVHVLLGHAQQAAGDAHKAARSWERARALLRAADPDEPVAFLAESSQRLLALLDTVTAGSSATSAEARP